MVSMQWKSRSQSETKESECEALARPAKRARTNEYEDGEQWELNNASSLAKAADLIHVQWTQRHLRASTTYQPQLRRTFRSDPPENDHNRNTAILLSCVFSV